MDFGKLMEQAQQMQASLAQIQEELAETIYIGKSQGIVVKMNGNNEITEIEIPDELINPEDKEMLQDMLLIAANEAADNVRQDREARSPAPGWTFSRRSRCRRTQHSGFLIHVSAEFTKTDRSIPASARCRGKNRGAVCACGQ